MSVCANVPRRRARMEVSHARWQKIGPLRAIVASRKRTATDSSAHGDWDADLEDGVDCDPTFSSGEETPLTQSVEENLIQARIRRRRHQRHVHVSLVGDFEARNCFGLEDILAQIVGDDWCGRIDRTSAGGVRSYSAAAGSFA